MYEVGNEMIAERTSHCNFYNTVYAFSAGLELLRLQVSRNTLFLLPPEEWVQPPHGEAFQCSGTRHGVWDRLLFSLDQGLF